MVYFTERYHPLFVTLSWGKWDAADFAAYLRAFRSVVARGDRYVTMSEARWSSLPGANERKQIAEMADEVSKLTAGLNVGSVAVLGSRLAVGAATAVEWLSRRKSPVVYVSSAADAMIRLRALSAPHRLVLPAESEELARELDRLASKGGEPSIDRIRGLL